jgi:hypothetical protein
VPDQITVRSRQRWTAERYSQAEYVAIVSGPREAWPPGMQAVNTSPGMRALYVLTADGKWTPLAVDGWIVTNSNGQRIVLTDAEMDARYEMDGAGGASIGSAGPVGIPGANIFNPSAFGSGGAQF